MTVAHEEIWVQCTQIYVQMAHPVGPIDTTHDAKLLALLCQALERHPYARCADHSIKDCDFHFSTLALYLFDLLLKLG